MSKMIIERNLLKIEIADVPYSAEYINAKETEAARVLEVDANLTKYFVTSGKLSNKAYSSDGNSLKIGMKDGTLKELSETSEIYNLTNDQRPQIKYFITSVK
jgi:hypothetical protein